MSGGTSKKQVPEILAPAGDEASFLAALAAGADAVYLGLKNFSARMEAENFGLAPLSRLAELAHAEGRRVYVAMNTMLKASECVHALRLVARLAGQVGPDALIVQDPALPEIARQAGFGGQIHFSTLANVSDSSGLLTARKAGAARVILPRELALEEVVHMGNACPPGLELEIFVHGALCYCVSGRCYWSSLMGGKSGLRGRCVQPCRRMYNRDPDKPASKREARYFSCQDLELADYARQLCDIPNLSSWKIEGRKKGPHYVFHTVTAYRLLRDNPGDAAAARDAREILEMALGRPTVKARFSPRARAQQPGAQTSSGLYVGKVGSGPDGAWVSPRLELLAGDYLRIGVEDEKWHAKVPVRKGVPKGGRFFLQKEKRQRGGSRGNGGRTPPAGAPVFLIDRREPGLMTSISAWRQKLSAFAGQEVREPLVKLELPPAARPRPRRDIVVSTGRNARTPANVRGLPALWLGQRCSGLSAPEIRRVCFWLPPVIWPEEEGRFSSLIGRLWAAGARHFVCNAPWQRAFFPEKLPAEADLAAGPFCNIANPLAIGQLGRLGFSSAIASPELPAGDLLALPEKSPLPLGLVLTGWWPAGLSRFGLVGIEPDEPFKSPKGEIFWARNYAGTTWIYPAWPLDLSARRHELSAAGYSFFVHLAEKTPARLPKLTRPGLFNWDGGLL